ncbi:NADH-quinone oxidoreductase subunit M [Rurimicrobium arvi]|uniref:NADH-quinone oxidoreductase subunit M n=1 Tax=Rurimicrobium arvi TaxID=2049916 RepID=A0ABP8MJJ7_9BACT
MILVLLILIPLLVGAVSFFAKGGARNLSLLGALCTLALSAFVASNCGGARIESFSMNWMPALGAKFSLSADGMAAMLCLLTGIILPVVLVLDRQKEREASYYGLIMLSQAGLMGVFLASDALLFYFFWELALIPVYFLCSRWGGEKRIAVTFKFFVYTFLGSLMMLAALIYLSLQTSGVDAFSRDNIIAAGKALPAMQQNIVFVLLFLAFAIKMPIFPFHTWQPDAYEQAPTPVTIILSALMVKMGLYAVVRWLLPVVPQAVSYWSETVMILSIIGIVYASLIAMVQTNVKRLVAYSSIAHMGLMCAAAFAQSQTAMDGLMVQMFNHGINIAAMWVIVNLVENRYGTQDMRQMGGLATTAPVIAISLVIISFANIALPLTNGFVGEFMLFTGIFQGVSGYSAVFMAVTGLGIILGAVYTLSMVQKVAYGENNSGVASVSGLSAAELTSVIVLLAFIIVLGVYPQPLINLVTL